MFDLNNGIAVGGQNPDFAGDPSMALNAVIYVTTDGKNWRPVSAPPTNELHGMGAFGMSGVVVADWAGNIWRKSGSVLEGTPTPEPTWSPTPTGTSTPTATNTPTATLTPTATATNTPTATPTATDVPVTGAVRPRAFADSNGDSLYAPGEPLLAGAQLELRSASQVIGNCTTDANGVCQFAGLAPGLYTLASTVAPPGYTSIVSTLTVSVQAGTIVAIDLPYVASTPTPTATPTSTATPTPTATPAIKRVWLPLVVRE
jgi:hypothetical protein